MIKKRIDDIEILRGFAVLFVVMHHSHGNLFTWTTPALDRFATYFGGWIGVDLFFAISGFIIARNLLPKLMAASSLEIAFRITVAFWIRRAWRLLPSAWLGLTLIMVAVIFFNSSGVFGSFRANAEATFAAILQVANLRFAETFGRTEYGASFFYWSLSLEEQFYLCLPLIACLSRRFLPYLLLILAVFQLCSTRTLIMVVFRTDALAMGVLLALWSQHETYVIAKPAFLSRSRFVATLLMTAAFICMGALGSDTLHIVSYRFSMIALLAIMLVWLASYDQNFFLTTGYLKKVMLWMGSRSYAIYLIHIPAFLITREIWFRAQSGAPFDDDLFYLFILTAATLIITFSELNYRLLEMPLRARGARIANRMVNAENCTAAQLPEQHTKLQIKS